MMPKIPEPGDYVTLSIQSYSLDLNTSNISYYINGKFYSSGTGEKTLFFQMPKGSYNPIKIDIIAEGFNGGAERKNITIQPASVDLIYEVQNPYRPLFYQGKSVAVSQAKIKFFAFPNFYTKDGKLIDKKTITYTWKVNNNIKLGQSGYGRDTLLINRIRGYPKKTLVEVEARSLDGKIVAVRSINIKPLYPEVEFYFDDGLLPFKFKNVAKSKHIISNTIDNTVVAIPYFFSNINIADVQWKINGTVINLIDNYDNLRMEIIRNEKNLFSTLKLNLNIENNNRILQTANNSIYFSSSDSLKDEYKKQRELDRFNNKQNTNDSFFGL